MVTTFAERLDEVRAEFNYIVVEYVHADGSHTFIVPDDDGNNANPREDHGNLTTLINENNRTIDIDSDYAGLAEARGHFWAYDERHHNPQAWSEGFYDRYIKFRAESKHSREDMVRRYVAIFRDDVAYYADHFSAGDTYGWGYITTAALDAAFPLDLIGGDREAYFERNDMTLEGFFDAEVKVYEQWANGEVYGAIHVSPDADIVETDFTGSTVVGQEFSEESCWGFFGYDDHKDIAATFTDSPVTETH